MGKAVSNKNDRPLVTFALFAYNQEEYIREAIEGAFSQSYEPLEIILSDDGSSDATFEIMETMAAKYQGPHTVKVRQSVENRGLANHINECAEEIHGAIVIMAAGDDVSYPNRTEQIVEEFQSGKEVYGVLSGYRTIPENFEGKHSYAIRNKKISLAEIIMSGGGVQIGATYGYRKECFTNPTKLPSWLESEDRLLPFRAKMLGKVHYIDDVLIDYRVQLGQKKIEKNKKRVESYNHPEHMNLLFMELNQFHKNGDINRFKFFYAKLLLKGLQTLISKGSKYGFWGIIRQIILLVMRLIRKLSTMINKF